MNTDVVALLLAAGRSSRMGGAHKLLATFDGVPLVRRSALAALGSKARRSIAILGHEAEAITAALDGLPIGLIRNDRYAEGLSTSLIAGFDVAGPEAAGVLIMLADQPFVTSADLDRLIDAFRPEGPGSIVVATDRGQRFNPVVVSGFYRVQVRALTGDRGARGIIAANGHAVRDVEIGRAASVDVDTPEAMAAAGGILAER